MDNKKNESAYVDSIRSTQGKNNIVLPLIALGLDLSPILLVYLSSFIQRFSSLAILFIVVMPIAGLVTGVVSLNRGKGRMGIAGKVIAIAAIVLPLALIALIIIFFIGASTGIISLM